MRAVIVLGELGAVGAGHLAILELRGRGGHVRLPRRDPLGRRRSNGQAAPAAVEAHAAHRPAIDHGAVEGVVYADAAEVVDAAVVEEAPASPIAALVAVAIVAEAVVDA